MPSRHRYANTAAASSAAATAGATRAETSPAAASEEDESPSEEDESPSEEDESPSEEDESPSEPASVREVDEFFPGIPLPDDVKTEFMDLRDGGGCYAVREAVSDDEFDDFVVLKFPEGANSSPDSSIPFEVAVLADLQEPPREVILVPVEEGEMEWFGDEFEIFYGQAYFDDVWERDNMRIGFGVADGGRWIAAFSDFIWSAECAESTNPLTCEDTFIHNCGDAAPVPSSAQQARAGSLRSRFAHL